MEEGARPTGALQRQPYLALRIKHKMQERATSIELSGWVVKVAEPKLSVRNQLFTAVCYKVSASALVHPSANHSNNVRLCTTKKPFACVYSSAV